MKVGSPARFILNKLHVAEYQELECSVMFEEVQDCFGKCVPEMTTLLAA